MRFIKLLLVFANLTLVACSTTKPEDGFVQATAIASDSWPETAVGIRLAVKTKDPNGYWVVSEAFLSATEELLSAHSARNDTTIIETTFSLPPDVYHFFLEVLERPEHSYPGTYYSMDLLPLEVESGKTNIIRLEGSFTFYFHK